MSYILNIETATEVCSVSISKDNEIIYYKEETKGPSHAVLLGVFVNDAINEMRAKNIKLDAVAVSCGPGSYTGLRIGISEAKGLCYGLSIPLIAINTLKIMAQGIVDNKAIDNNAILCPMIDARRMEVYDLLLDTDLNEIRPTSADIIDENSFADILKEKQIVFFGNGAAKCKEVLPKQNTIFIDGIYPKASDMVKLANEAYAKQDFVDVAYFEPFYLKEFVATTPKNKVLG
ncbi:tRNA (adenosine(37)-N6)-threonylcarbamoyltransferase complex dimerization subunit type 1 TsaB [Dysgonomonas sp. Marseille-P4361]|uniref:tRNA (adenosine(37)-N6)-threonylcarbamoyltransferase complex dimerization subunit type 1 TsaB n=1 Tax=Dysgonomonas sp. Marseille-P4361 TaxID=2161820 RepID=UPI000D54E4C5|nr:tRNA (adenosine(37)-N6)-threonylcarbamoyltransferase complex dimerization subunit type 1 TsaB [Dysgonomonas sp. Marseille-P4361]